jgi:hypothetical protein
MIWLAARTGARVDAELASCSKSTIPHSRPWRSRYPRGLKSRSDPAGAAAAYLVAHSSALTALSFATRRGVMALDHAE